MGIVYYQKEDYVNAEKFYNEALYNFQLFDSNYDIEKYYGINTSLLNLSLIKRDQGDLKSSEELLNQLFERVNSNAISKTDVLQVYISYMELFLVSGNDELFVNYYSKIKTAHEKMISSGYDNIIYLESSNALGNDFEGTVDAVHFTDLGFKRYSNFLIEKFKEYDLLND